MHNALRWFLLWTLFPFVIVAADPPPPLVRSVLSTNLPPFGLTGQALFRTANLPYLDWSNIVQQVIDTNAFQPASANLTNWSLISTNALTGKLDSNVWWAAWGSLDTNALTGKLDSNYWFTVWGAIGTNALTAKLDSNWWWTAYGGKVLTNAGAFIASQTGFGTNTTFRSSANTTVPLVISNQIGSTTNSFEIPGTNGVGFGKDFVITSDGKAGFGTNLPQAVFDFYARSNGPSQYIWRIGNGMLSAVGLATNAVSYSTNGTLLLRSTAGANADWYVNADGSLHSWEMVNPAASGDSVYFDGSGILFGVSSASKTYRFATGKVGIGTNSPQSALHVVGDNSAANATIIQTTNRFIQRWDTNGNSYLAGAFTPTNGIINLVSNSFIANLVIVTNNPQIYCLNGTNQLITLPDCTKIPVGQIMRFSSTNGYGSFTLTNATGSQTIRDGTSLSLAFVGVGEISVFNDGAAWWLGNKTKTIWPNASWSTTTNVPLAVTGSNYISFDQLETSNSQGITLSNAYQIYVRDAGQYLLTISVVTQVGHNNDTNRLWLQQSGQNLPRTRTDVKLPTTTAQTVMTVNFVVPVVTNLTWFGICVRSTDTGSQLVTGAAGDATMPAMPSAIVTVNKISDTFP